MPLSAYICLLNVKTAWVPLINHLNFFPLALQKKFVVVFTGTVRLDGASKISTKRQNIMHPFIHSMHQYHGYKFASMLSKCVDLADDLNDMHRLKNYSYHSYLYKVHRTAITNCHWTCTLCTCIARKQQDLKHKRCQRRESQRHSGGTLTCYVDPDRTFLTGQTKKPAYLHCWI